jgi:glycine cleavage system P protein (glycine dehydrogenase) subunit 1
LRYVPHSEDDVREMLAAIGVDSIDDLFAEIPEEVRFKGRLDLPGPVSESELLDELANLSILGNGGDWPYHTSFLGAGVYDGYVPAVVDAITGRSEFFTEYTPYQAERSQGVLQAIFEFQTAICELTGLDVANASLYDGATAAAEAVFVARAQTGRAAGTVAVARAVHPEYRQVTATETKGVGIRLVKVPFDDGGLTDLAALRAAVDSQTAAVVLQQPNFFGGIEAMSEAAAIAHDAGALLIAVVDPISLGLLAPPGEYGADIAVGEGQSLGNRQNYGGPGFGFMAARKELIRRLPGRIVGETADVDGKRGFVLTLQTREQHIRRENATSNICSNHALNALAGLVYLSWLGKQGLPELALHLARKADYLRSRLLELPGVEPFTRGPVFREFAVRLSKKAGEVIDDLAHDDDRFAGVTLGRWWPELDQVLLVAVNEKQSRRELDDLVEAMGEHLA